MTNLLNLDYLKSQALSYGTEPYWFGLGFIQLKLNDRERMHFWLPEIPRPEREEIHNHRYDFTSTVLAGALRHEVYHLDMKTSQFATVATEYEIFETNCGPSHEGTVEVVSPCVISKVGTFTLQAGSTYAFPHTAFHTTEGTKFAVTHLQRQPKMLEFASVIKKAGAPTSCPFAEKIPAKQCWDYVELALTLALEEPLKIIPCDSCGRPSGSFGNKQPRTVYFCLGCGLD